MPCNRTSDQGSDPCSNRSQQSGKTPGGRRSRPDSNPQPGETDQSPPCDRGFNCKRGRWRPPMNPLSRPIDETRRSAVASRPRSTQCCATAGCRPGKDQASDHVACDFFACSLRRHESVTFSRTSVQHAAFVRVKELHHDRFGSRRSTLRNAGAWPCRGAGGRQGLQARRSGRFGDQAGGPDQERGRAGRQDPARRCEADADAAFKRNDFRTGLQILGQIAATSPEDSGNWLRLARTIFQITPDQHQRTDLPDGTRLDRRLYRLPARRQRRRRGRRARRARPGDVRTQAVASGAGCVAAVARFARGRRRPRPIREAARRARLPAAGLHRRFRLGLAAGLFPVLRGTRQAHRFRAVPGAGRQRQAGAVGSEGKAALRRRPQAWRALQHQPARRPAVHRQGNPAEIGRIQHLCARPQAVRALHRPRLRAAAHRPARHSAGQRQHAGGDGQRVPDRRPQPDQHGDRQRFSARAEQVRAFRSRRRARRQGLVGRTRHRDHAQPGRHHRIPGRSGARRAAARRLCHDRGGQGPGQR